MKKLCIEDIKRAFELEHYQLLTDVYENSSQKLKFICSNGHEHSMRWDSWKRGSRCGKCYKKNTDKEVKPKRKRQKITIEYIRSVFVSEGYTLLTEAYKRNSQKLDFICPNGHKYSITWDSWKSGKRCGVCYGSVKKDINYIRKAFESEGYTLLTEIYENNKQKLEYICPEGHSRSIAWSKWQAGQRCATCKGKAKKDINYIREAFEVENYQLLTTVYENCSQKLEYVCPEGHKHSISWDNWKQGQRCGICGNLRKIEINATEKRYDILDIKKSFEAEGYQLLTKVYENKKQKLEFICPNGHKHSISWDNWFAGHRCGICFGSKKADIGLIKKDFESEGYQLLTTEYKNNSQKLEFICPNNHTHYITWVNWQKGRRCGVCAGKVKKDINEIRQSFKADGYQLLISVYENNQQQLEYICPNGHYHTIKWHEWINGKRCGICSGNKKLTIKFVKESFESEGYQLLTTEYKNNSQKLEFICPNNHEYQISWASWSQGHRCGKCGDVNISRPEKEIVDFLKPFFPSLIENNRNIIAPYELDIVISEKRIAIEYCGLYWHSEVAGKERSYHLKKLKMCKEIGYRLITIFEDEWVNRRFTVEAFLKTILHINESEKVHARKCTIKEIDHRNAKEFLEEYHLLGSGALYISLGAYYNDQLIAVSTFSKPSLGRGSYKKKEAQIEWNRFCLHSDYRVPGIASKFLKHFERNYIEFEKIFTFADRRWSEGNLYEQLGFELVSETPHNYWYFKRHDERTHRFSLRKKPDEPKNQTEWELRQAEGWNRIWDCGLLKFEKDIGKEK